MDFKKKKADELAEISRIRPLEVDPLAGQPGILLSDEITLFAERYNLIAPFRKENLKPAGYELTVGDEYFMSGQYMALDSHVTIQPFEVAVIKTGERVRLPRFMIARWNIRVRHAYAGLLWVGGPQVDPGYAGYLFCPIYNLSDKPVTLNRGEELALMDFSRTTPFNPAKGKELVRYDFPPKRVTLEEFNIIDFQSALFTRAGRKIEEFEESLKTLEGRFIQFTQISFAIFAMALTLLAIYSKAGSTALDAYAGYLGPLTLGLSIAAFVMAFFSHWQSRLSRASLDRYPAPLSRRIREVRRFLSISWIASMGVCLFVGVASLFVVQYLTPNKKLEEQSAKISISEKNASDALAIAKAMEQRVLALQRENEELRRGSPAELQLQGTHTNP
jgi:deoxycytidine triphosphate deaminase